MSSRGRRAVFPYSARKPHVAVITGASAGVGRATAREFASTGTDVALLARGADGLRTAAKEVEGKGRRALPIEVDVAHADSVERAAQQVERELGEIDVWVNCAMASVFAPFEEITPEEFRRVTEVTYLGYVHGTRAALRRMLPRDRGVIVQVGSALAYRAIPLQSAYCGAKHAIQGFTESIRTELIHRGTAVRVCQAHLPAVNTPQFDWVLSRLPNRAQPVPPIYQPEVPARAIVHLARRPRREMWVGESTVATIIANRLFPGILDRYLGKTGFASQQTDEPEWTGRPHNLWEPVPEDFGAHGRFDQRAFARSAQVWMATHRTLTALAAAGAALVCSRVFGGRPR